MPVGSIALPTRMMTFEEQRDILFRLGYFICDDWPDFSAKTKKEVFQKVSSSSSFNFERAVYNFQNFYIEDYSEQYEDRCANIDGHFGPKTMQAMENMMARRFCSCPDFEPLGEGLRRWSFMDVQYGHELGQLPGVSSEQAHKSYVEAWNRWNRVCGLRTVYTGNTRNANVQAFAKRIDGSGGTLAWSYLPDSRGDGSGPNTQLEQRYDTGDRWANNVAFQIEVMTHENGHAIGLSHDNGRDANGNRSIMSSAAIGIQKLNLNDIKRAVARYGKNTDGPVPPLPPSIPSESTIMLVEGDGKIRQFVEVPEGWVV